MMHFKFSSHLLPVLLILCGMAGAAEKPQGKKLIYADTAVPTYCSQLQKTTAAMQSLPVDGMVIRPVLTLERNGRKKYYDSFKANGQTLRLESKDLQPWQQAFSRLTLKKLKNNFIGTATTAIPADWFDETAWQKSLNHYVMLSRLARQTGCRGLVLDTAPADIATGAPFAFRPGKRSLTEVRQQVRKRGQQWIQAVSREFSSIEILFTLWLSSFSEIAASGDLALLPDFALGILEAAPETVRIIDGSRHMLRPSAEARDFHQPASEIYLQSRGFIPRDVREKFFKISSLALPLALPESPSKTANLNFLNELEKSTVCTDQYILLSGSVQKSPYLRQILHAGTDPVAAARQYAAGKNLLYNGKFAPCPSYGQAEPDTLYFGAGGWFSWQDNRKKQGRILLEKEGVAFRSIAKGSIVQSVHHIPRGVRLLLTGRAKVSGSSLVPQLSCNFRNQKNQFMRKSQVVVKFGPPDAAGWRHAAAIVDVPAADMKYMTVNASVSSGRFPPDADEVCHVAEITLHRVVYPWNK